MSGVKVAVRVRPFNQRELDLNSVCCVSMNGVTTSIIDLESGEKSEPRNFTFDYSYWSHDGFEDIDGYSAPLPGSNYADQKIVFNDLGKEVLDNAWEGYHACLFAYGQTGAGKSYSMVGYGKNRGIVPTACEEIFKRIAENTESDKSYEVMVGMLEIYNECVQDLLCNPRDRPKSGLEIRESKQLGVYVEGITKVPVASYSEISAVTDRGTANRTVGATLMNATSSRAHTVVMIEFTQVTHFAGKQGRKTSVINLVDLAGSEKASKTEATGDRLKEGCAINKSLSALGNVVSALADKAAGKGKGIIPYRDSKLTRLLQNALGGSSKTIMVCAVSPSSNNYAESLSTLRYAERAKKIKNHAVVNEDPTEKLIRELKEENAKLKALLEGKEIPGGPNGNESTESLRKAHEEEIKAMEAALAEMQKSWEDKLKEAQSKAPQAISGPDWDTTCHLTVLNEDTLLSGKLSFEIPTTPAQLHIGKKREDVVPDVVLSGMGVCPQHCHCELRSNNEAYLIVDEGGNATFLNGHKLEKGAEAPLKNGDRIVVGQTYVFLVVLPSEGQLSRETLLSTYSYEEAMRELAHEQGDLKSTKKSEEQEKEETMRRTQYKEKLKEAEHALEQQKKEYEQKLQEMQQRLSEEQLQTLREEFQAEQRQLESKRREIEATELKRIQAESDLALLNERLTHILPLIKEANLIAKELKKPYVLKPKLYVGMTRRGKKTDVVIGVNFNGVEVYTWHSDILENRIYLMRELLDKWLDAPQGEAFLAALSHDEDPFWDPVEEDKLIGTGQLYLNSLAMQLQNEGSIKLFDPEARPCGQLEVGVYPVTEKGEDIPDEDIKDSPEDLLGSIMHYKVKVLKASGLPQELAHNVCVKFRTYLSDALEATKRVEGAVTNPVFNFEHIYSQNPVTEEFLDYIQTDALEFQVWSKPVSAQSAMADVQSAAKDVQSATKEVQSATKDASAKERSGPGVRYWYNGYDSEGVGDARANVISYFPGRTPSAAVPLTVRQTKKVKDTVGKDMATGAYTYNGYAGQKQKQDQQHNDNHHASHSKGEHRKPQNQDKKDRPHRKSESTKKSDQDTKKATPPAEVTPSEPTAKKSGQEQAQSAHPSAKAEAPAESRPKAEAPAPQAAEAEKPAEGPKEESTPGEGAPAPHTEDTTTAVQPSRQHMFKSPMSTCCVIQ